MTLSAILTAIHAVDGVLTWIYGRETERNSVARFFLKLGLIPFASYKILSTVLIVWACEWCRTVGLWVGITAYTIGVGSIGYCLVANIVYCCRTFWRAK